MKVYVVTTGEYSDYGISAIFSTKEKAEAHCETLRAEEYCNEKPNDIEEYELDEMVGAVRSTVWNVTIEHVSGKIHDAFHPHLTMHPPGRYTNVWEGKCWSDGGWVRCISVESSVSKEHATEVAVEGRQKWLRLRDSFRTNVIDEKNNDDSTE
jgi:hypothetical protein